MNWVRDADSAEAFQARLNTDPRHAIDSGQVEVAAPKVQTGTDHKTGDKTGTKAGEAAPAKPPTISVVGTIPSLERGHELMQRLASGDKTVLDELGFAHEGRTDKVEWGLGKKTDGTIVLLRGQFGEVDFDQIPGIVALAHSHPARDLDIAKGKPQGVPIHELMHNKNWGDLARFLPSTGDLGYFTESSIHQHIVYTPFVHTGEMRVGNPTQSTDVLATSRIEIVVQGAKMVGRSAIQPHIAAYSADIIIRAGDGTVLWYGPIYTTKPDGMGDVVEINPVSIEIGVPPAPPPPGREAPEGEHDKSGTRPKAQAGDDRHAPNGAWAWDGHVPRPGEVMSFQSVSGNFYRGTFQGFNERGQLILDMGQGPQLLDPNRLVTGRLGMSVPELHAFGPHTTIKLTSRSGNVRTGAILGYDEQGNVRFQLQSGEIQLLVPGALDLTKTELVPVPAKAVHPQHPQAPQPQAPTSTDPQQVGSAPDDHDGDLEQAQGPTLPQREHAQQADERAKVPRHSGGRYNLVDDPTADILHDKNPTPDVQKLQQEARTRHPGDEEEQQNYIWKQLKGGVLRKSLLARRNTEVSVVAEVLVRHGVTNANVEAVQQMFDYVFNSAGLGFHYPNYQAWTRLASANPTVADIRWFIHETTEIGIMAAEGVDFMGKALVIDSKPHAEWYENTFEPAYLRAHRQALRAEYQYLADQLAKVTGEARRLAPEVVAAIDPVSDEGRERMAMADGSDLSASPKLPTWRAIANETVSLPPDVAARLGVPTEIKLGELVRVVRESRAVEQSLPTSNEAPVEKAPVTKAQPTTKPSPRGRDSGPGGSEVGRSARSSARSGMDDLKALVHSTTASRKLDRSARTS